MTVTGPGLRTVVITDADGRFDVGSLILPGSGKYSLRAELPGFTTTTLSGVSADLGSTGEIEVRMAVACLSDPHRVPRPLADRLESADLVALIRIEASTRHDFVTHSGVCGPVMEYRAVVVDSVKNALPGSVIQFFDVPNVTRTMASGTEAVVLLQRRDGRDDFQMDVPASLVSVNLGLASLGELTHDGTSLEVPVGEAIDRLRSRVNQR